ncbi:hypothetical protein A4E84_06485 [Streptomyces qaidamensis]|uniref:Uncharacterized protein n=1 Tax=Streptomyces qaidamensis TaxID=1783515 RepID=A0A143BW81_9ACTN|nr:hypothetical protein A4E84_06485 [Streptomyces qaidamensis]
MGLDLADGEPAVSKRSGLDRQGLRHDGLASPDATALACGLQSILRLLDDVAAPVFSEREGKVEDEGSFLVLASRDALQHLDGDAALEEVVEDDESFEEVAAEAVDFLEQSMSPSRKYSMAALSPGRSSAVSLPLIFSSKTLRQIGSRASCCRWTFCLSLLTRTRPTKGQLWGCLGGGGRCIRAGRDGVAGSGDGVAGICDSIAGRCSFLLVGAFRVLPVNGLVKLLRSCSA